jgi:hypothetical protein
MVPTEPEAQETTGLPATGALVSTGRRRPASTCRGAGAYSCKQCGLGHYEKMALFLRGYGEC